MTKQASATVSTTDDAARTFASGQRCQSRPVGIDAVEMVGASDKFAELQFTRLIERDEVRDVHHRSRAVAPAASQHAEKEFERIS